LVLAFLGIIFGREFIRTREIQQDIDLLQNRADELAARNLQIMELSTAFQTESFIEREARLKLGLKRAGEEVVVIQSGNQAINQPNTFQDPKLVLAEQELAAVDNPTKWWYYFFEQHKYEKLTQDEK
ncbi:septum formation initiator family protein, partial [Patescibacteria group bacterium]|nr:septum formation initiator family protein [Patescibacteria group bacterium]